MQFSLKIILAAITLLATYFALVKVSDAASAFVFMIMVGWLLSPVWLTFLVLHLEQGGRRKSRVPRKDTAVRNDANQ